MAAFAVFCGFLGGVALTSLISLSWLWVLYAVVLGFLFLTLYGTTRTRLFLLTAVVLIGGGVGMARTELTPRALPAPFAPLVSVSGEYIGKVTADPDTRETSERLTVEVQKDGATTRVLAVVPLYSGVRYGERVRITGTLQKPEPFETDGNRTFAYDAYLAKDGIFLMMPRAAVERVGPREGIADMLFGALLDGKHAFMNGLSSALPEPESALASGILVGGKQGLGRELLSDFTDTGLVQLVVLSGYNVMVVADGVRSALSFLPPRAALFGGGIGILLFVLVAGAGSAALRAGLMAALALYARATGRQYDALRALCAALVLMLLINPLLLVYDPGLQLSVVATIGLILFTPLIEQRLSWLRSAFLREVVATTGAAQVAVLPLLLYQTGNLSLISFVANVITTPVMPAAMALSFIAGLAGLLVPPAAPVFGLPAYAVLSYVVWVAETGAALPLSHLTLPSFPFVLVLGAYAFYAWFCVRAKSPLPGSGAQVRTNSHS